MNTEIERKADMLRNIFAADGRERGMQHQPEIVVKGERIMALQQFLFTAAILADVDEYGYADRWCYHDMAAARAALDAWSGAEDTEPQGWHRHPDSGRRRPDGDPAQEYVRR